MTTIVSSNNSSSDDSIFKAKILNEHMEADSKINAVIAAFKLYGQDINYKPSETEKKIEEKIEKYSNKKLLKELEKVKSYSDLEILNDRYMNALEHIAKDIAECELKSKTHMKEYVAMFAALKSIQNLLNSQQNRVFSPKDMQKDFKNNFEKNLSNITKDISIKNSKIEHKANNSNITGRILNKFNQFIAIIKPTYLPIINKKISENSRISIENISKKDEKLVKIEQKINEKMLKSEQILAKNSEKNEEESIKIAQKTNEKSVKIEQKINEKMLTDKQILQKNDNYLSKIIKNNDTCFLQREINEYVERGLIVAKDDSKIGDPCVNKCGNGVSR